MNMLDLRVQFPCKELPEFDGKFMAIHPEGGIWTVCISNNWSYKYKIESMADTMAIRDIDDSNNTIRIALLRSPADLCDYMPFMFLAGFADDLKYFINNLLGTKVYV